MGDSFVPSLIALRNSNPDIVIAKLHDMFAVITKMDADQLVAGYQTLTEVARSMGLTQDATVQALFKAMRLQMECIVADSKGRKTQRRFEVLTGMQIGEHTAFGEHFGLR